MFFLQNMIIEIRSIGLNTSRVISLSYIKCDKLLFVVLLTVIWSINSSNSLDQQDHQGSNGGQFVGEKEAEAIALEANIRLAKIPCNFTTKINCIYAEGQKLSLPVKDFLFHHSQQQITNEIVVTWLPHSGLINTTEKSFKSNNSISSSNNSSSIHNVREKPQNDFYNFNWIFELLACMMLASAFEICLLVLRNLRNISLAFFGFWSAFNTSLQNLCGSCSTTTTTPSFSHKTDQQSRSRNVAIGEKRTLSYIFAILTWRASQTAKGGSPTTEENSRDESQQNAINYGHVTTMGDLLLLILFTHVYYQRQRVQQDVGNEVNADTPDSEHLLKVNNKVKEQSCTAYQKLYDAKQNNNDNNNVFNEQSSPAQRRAGLSNKRCSHFCGNMYQQISSQQQEQKSSPNKLATTTLTSCASKIPYLTYCPGFVWYTCCFCQCFCRLCCYCCANCHCWNHRCYIYRPLCNSIYCCCFYKSLKSFHDVKSCQYCCYLCCGQNVCHPSKLSSSHAAATFHCCHCHTYCRLCNSSTTNKTPVRNVNLLLLNKTKNSTPSNDDYCVWKLIWNNQNYNIFYQIDGQSCSLLHVTTDVESMFLYKRSSTSCYYQFAINAFSCLLPQYLLNIKNCQALLKWKRLHVAVVVLALIVMCASSGGGANYNHHQYYSALLNRCNKHFSKCRQNKKRRKRRRRRHQHCKAYRPQHYFYTALIQCVNRQKSKKLPKNFINKLHKQSPKLLTTTTTQNYEHCLAAATVISTKSPMVRTIRRVRGSKPNIVWLLIGLIWFEGPKIVNCNVIINYQNQQQPEQQQQHQQQAGNNAHKETITNSVNSNFEYKIENFNQIKTKNSNNNSNSNSNNSNNSNKNKNKNNSNSNNNSNNSTNNNNRSTPNTTSNNNSTTSSSSNNIRLSVNVIPIMNTIHLKHYCNSNYHQKLIRSTQRVQRALKINSNLDTSITSSAYPNYNNVNDDFDSEEMPSSAFQNINEESHDQSDLMRLESIKHQILFKLGLTRKPNVSHPLPKQFIWDTIYRADGIKSFHEFSNANNFQGHQHYPPQQNDPYWSKTPPSAKGATVVPLNIFQQRQQREDRSHDSNDSEDIADNIKRSLESINVVRKKFNKNRQQHQKQQTHSKHYNNNDIMYRKGTIATTSTTNTNRNKMINHTNQTVNNFTILKQSKHQQFYKNSPHSTITTITSAKKPITHQQQINQHTNNNNKNNIKNNNNNNNNNNSNNDNVNNSNNNKNSNNNIIMVQKHLRNNNKYIEEEKKFTYLTDINSSDDSSNIMEDHKSPDSDDNNSILRKKTHQQQHYHHHNQDDHVQPLQLQQKHEKTTENYQYLNVDNDGIVNVDGNINVEPEILHENNEAERDDNDDDDEGDRYYRHDQRQHQHDNYFSKLDTFEENEDFFGSTQEIITFAEKGKMYKNHRLVEFSHQNNEKSKQKLHVRYAEIHIRIDKISLKNKSRAGSGIKHKRLKIWIFQLIENNYTYKGFDHVAQFCASFEVNTSRLGWKKFDITTTVKEWYSRREGEKLRLLIDCTGCGKMYSVHLFNSNSARGDFSIRERRIADERRNTNMNGINSKHFYNVTHNNDDLARLQYNKTFVLTENSNRRNSINADNNKDDEDVLNSSRPFLVLHTEAKRQRRVRRRAINCNGALHGQCCKESFYVSFKALGWDDWIIAPRGYFANYCRGDCTGPYRTPDTFQTFHAHFIEEYRKMGLLNGMQPCCAPIKFSSMSLIYYGDEGIIKRDLPKMVVDECGCP